MMIWEMLGIEPTRDVAAIKKAYAARAKECHPEEHPKEYQRLRSAYKWAIQYAKRTPGAGLPPGIFPDPLQETPKSEQESAEQEEPEEQGEPEVEFDFSVLEEDKPKPAEQPEEEPESKLYFSLADEKQPGTEQDPKQEPKVHTEEEPRVGNEDFSDKKLDDYALSKIMEQLFTEFEYIQWNPYLINNPLVWSCLCDKPHRKELFARAGFRKELAARICNTPKMRMEAFIFWDQLFAWYGEEIRQQKDWKKKQHACARESHFSRAEHMATRKEKSCHEKMLEQLRQNGMDTRLNTKESVAGYLDCYISYMNRHYSQIRKAYRSREQWRSFRNVVLVIGMGVLMGTGLFLTSYLSWDWKDEPSLEEELRIQNERRLEKDYIIRRDQIIDQTLETYESWLEEEKSTEGY